MKIKRPNGIYGNLTKLFTGLGAKRACNGIGYGVGMVQLYQNTHTYIEREYGIGTARISRRIKGRCDLFFY